MNKMKTCVEGGAPGVEPCLLCSREQQTARLKNKVSPAICCQKRPSLQGKLKALSRVKAWAPEAGQTRPFLSRESV